jgi:hypothetical protein
MAKRPKKKRPLTDARLAIHNEGFEVWVRRVAPSPHVPGALRGRLTRAIDDLPPGLGTLRELLEDVEVVLDAAIPIVGEMYERAESGSNEEHAAKAVWELIQ